MEPRAAWNDHNFHVLNILPVTTFRTIDLGGKKNSSPLFSRFCEEQRVFLKDTRSSWSGIKRADNLGHFKSIFADLQRLYHDLDSFKRLLNVLHRVAQNYRAAVGTGHWAFGFG